MDQQLIAAIEAELDAGRRCMLATILEQDGSAPRGAGTAMVVFAAGGQTGTVGGGSMEYRVRCDALELLGQEACALRRYEIHADDKQAYSGGVTILFRWFAGEAGQALAADMRRALDSGEDAYLTCRMAEGGAPESAVRYAHGLCLDCGIACPPSAAVLTGDGPRWFIEPLLRAPRVVILGGGHVAQCMARQLGLLDYRVWVAEDRAEFARPELFPAAERVLHCGYARAEAQLQLTRRDHAIVMSRGHETDYEILRWLLRSQADYIGCIGSRKKIALTKERLRADGLNEAELSRLHAPIGLAIGAETPAEIAVSVAAELIRHCYGKE